MGQGPIGPASAKVQVGQAIRSRAQTDEILSMAWILAPILAPVIFVVLFFIAFLAAFSTIVSAPTQNVFAAQLGFSTFIVLAFLIPAALYIFLLYKLIKRMNEHFRRESSLRRGMIDYIRGTAAGANRSNEISVELATMETIHAEADADDDAKSPAVWIILSLIPFVNIFAGLYVLYFLTKWPFKHDSRWQAFSRQAQSAVAKLGMVIVAPTWKALEKRSFGIFFILALVTLGLFAIYWYYVLIKDPNEHFKAHAQFEDALASLIGA